jgi:hypothetical protein
LDIDGNAGPKIKKIFTCEGCEYLSSYPYGDNYIKRSCLHPDVLSKYGGDSQIMMRVFVGNIDSNLTTPMFCPYLIKKLRYEKIKEING